MVSGSNNLLAASTHPVAAALYAQKLIVHDDKTPL
jgi:hypothetical protein